MRAYTIMNAGFYTYRLVKSGCKKLSVLFFPFREQTPNRTLKGRLAGTFCTRHVGKWVQEVPFWTQAEHAATYQTECACDVTPLHLSRHFAIQSHDLCGIKLAHDFD